MGVSKDMAPGFGIFPLPPISEYEARREREVAAQCKSMIIKLTCYTKNYGTIIKELTTVDLPEFVAVEVDLPDHEVRKFDPRNDWDSWTTQNVDPFKGTIACKHFAGTLYIEEGLRFMQKAIALKVSDESKYIIKASDRAFGKVKESLRSPFHYEFNHSDPYGIVRSDVS